MWTRARFRRSASSSLALSPTQVNSGESEVSKYAFRGAFEESAVREYIEMFFRGELKPYIRSEEPRKEREGNVKVLVGSDYEAFVNDPNVNVLVEYVLPVGMSGWRHE